MALIQLTKSFLALLSALLIATSCYSQNPITTELGVSDPHIRVFNDTIYLFSGHDSSPEDKLWVMKDWRVFATTNLLDWKLVQTISPKENYMNDTSEDCWATDAATRNGKYYFYFSDKKNGIGVMSATNPKGPYQDALGKPLIAPLHDPTIFIDDNSTKTPYIVYGDKADSYYIAELNEDMISLAEKPKPITINGIAWEKAPVWMDKNYLFKYKDTYYLSWGRDYATSKNVYGPYSCAGSVGIGHHLDEFAHGSFFWWKGQFYHIWCYYLKNGYKFRESIISYCHIDDNGKIVTDTSFLDQHFTNGVGQYNANWNKIEAEWYTEITPEIKKQGTQKEGFVLADIKNGSYVKFANVHFDTSFNEIEFYFNQIKGKGTVQVREGSIDGPVLGSTTVNGKNRDTSPHLVNVKISDNSIGKKDLYFKFIGNQNLQLQMDYFRFSIY